MKTLDMSGMGNHYEQACQLMLLNGMRFLKEHPHFDFSSYKTYSGVFGLCTAESEEAKALDEAISEGVDPSGAMHQEIISHLAFIHLNGYDAWIAKGEETGRVYEIDAEQLEKDFLIGKIEWQLKLDGGYNPLAELFKNIPPEDVIMVNPGDPNSIRLAAEEIARRMKSLTETEQ